MGLRLAAISLNQCGVREGFASVCAQLHEGDMVAQSLSGLERHGEFRNQEAGRRPRFWMDRRQHRRPAARVQLLQKQVGAPQGIVSHRVQINLRCKICFARAFLILSFGEEVFLER